MGTSKGTSLIPDKRIERSILLIRGRKVILDSDLAEIYGVRTGALNQAVKRNIERFPEDFAFRLTAEEVKDMRSHFAMSKLNSNLSQFVTGSQKHRDPCHPPIAFTEHGALMAANILKSPQAIQMSVFVMRAFVRLRQILASHADLARKLDALEKKYDKQFKVVFDVIRQLMTLPEKPRRKIGFHVKERKSRYTTGARKAKGKRKSA